MPPRQYRKTQTCWHHLRAASGFASLLVRCVHLSPSETSNAESKSGFVPRESGFVAGTRAGALQCWPTAAPLQSQKDAKRGCGQAGALCVGQSPDGEPLLGFQKALSPD